MTVIIHLCTCTYMCACNVLIDGDCQLSIFSCFSVDNNFVLCQSTLIYNTKLVKLNCVLDSK